MHRISRLVHPFVWLLSVALMAVAPAGSYGPQNFTFADDNTDLGDGTVIDSNTGVASVQGNYLRLTQDGVGGTASSFKLSDLDPGKESEAFTITFSLRMSTDDNPADGFSVNFGAIPDGYGGGEGGFAIPDGLIIAWDTYDNGSDSPSIEVFSDGISIANFPQSFSSVHNIWVPVNIHWDASGLDLTYNGTAITTDLAAPGFVPGVGNTVAFSARTGGATQDIFIDTLEVVTIPEAPITTGGVIICELVADNTRLDDEECDKPDWLELYNGQSAAVDLSGYFLTNDPQNKMLWSLPSVTMMPFEYRIVYASGKDRNDSGGLLHTNFTISKAGGYLALVASDGTTVLSEYTYGAQAEDIAYGELGSARTRGYMETPTPETKNAGLQASGLPAESVQFDRTGGMFVGSTTLTILPTMSATAVVRYTTNGTVPSQVSPAYSSPFSITGTTTVRARVFDAGRLPGEIKSRTLIELAADVADFNSALPIIVADSSGVNIDLASNPSAPRPFRNVYTVVIDRDPADYLARMTTTPDFTGRGGMHVRGQSSSGFPKKQYAWETWNNEDEDKDVSILGMPRESDWILHAPYSDKTLLRNMLVYESARDLYGDGGGMRAQFVELFMNVDGGSVSMSDYRGVYVVMEKIKRDGDRVDVEKLCDKVTDPALITGGYIFKKDKPPYSQAWSTAVEGVPLDTHVPNQLNAAQFGYLTTYVDSFETALHGDSFRDPNTGYAAYIDVPSFIDNHLFVECFKEIDGYRISQYFSKDRDEKIRALPIWDYNLALGNANYLEGQNPTGWYYSQLSGSNYYWYDRLFEDPEFTLVYWDRFWAHRRSMFADATLLAKIDAHDANLDAPNTSGESAVTRNFDRWDILGSYVWPNADDSDLRTTHQSEVDWMKGWLMTRMTWIETQSRGTGGIARPPTFNQYGGNVMAGFSLTMTDPNAWPGGDVYYTTDGGDPRIPSNGVTLVSETAGCEALVPSVANAGSTLTTAQWTTTAAPPNAANWTSGTQGVGYENAAANTYDPLIGLNVGSAMAGINETVYIRIPFNVADPSQFTQLSLLLKYDDSFVAYLNGVEVARDVSRTPATLSWNSGATDVHDDSLAQSFIAFDINSHIDKLQSGANMLAIHGLNRFPGSSDALWLASLVGQSNGNQPSATASIYSSAVPLAGGVEINARVYDGTQWSPLSNGLFAVNGATASSANITISELNYRPALPTAAEVAEGHLTRGDFEYLELLNTSATDHVSLVNAHFSRGVTFTFANDLGADALVLPPGGRAVIVDDAEAFRFRYGPSVIVAGTYAGSLSNDGERVTLLASDGSVIQDFTYNDVEPWPVGADGDGYALVLAEPLSTPVLSDPSSWRSSVSVGGTPGGDDTVPFTGVAGNDLDADGNQALIEYAMGASDDDGGSQRLPSVRLELMDVDGVVDEYVVFEFTKNLAAVGLTFSIESSTGVIAWTNVSEDFLYLSTTNNGDGTSTVSYCSVAPFPSEGVRGIYRLHVTQ
ncbi:MAG: hypothetical protein GWQ05_04370 [Verrucomicrobiaceae bacterium]|nr:hypothetical protein [Verrucomicrobiaceae bacterium]